MRNPKNEQETILLFAEYAERLGFQIQSLRTQFPDATVLRLEDNKVLEVEFEYKASNFTAHKHDPAKCDLIICWWNNIQSPFLVPVYEIKTEIQWIPRVVDNSVKEIFVRESNEIVKKHDRWIAAGWKIVFAAFLLSNLLRLINTWIAMGNFQK